ncbi:NAD(P)-binding domain-containing protein [Aurantimonas aggregata]|uniref:NAD(P)-binding domain-containing protein n=1 Tax=Aurantimonas aggregata TaxID=2047720 RepID=UPI0019407D21|nr:NAD(P)-binding domain-containing protein [Aurantimonas aggregata]
MKIGILGTGHIGKTLVTKLSAAGHDVNVANSRGDVRRSVCRRRDPVHAARPHSEDRPLFADVPADTVVIDTCKCYPKRDCEIAEIEAGQTESEWVAGKLDRSIAKARNAVTSASIAKRARLPEPRAGSPFPLPPTTTERARSRCRSSKIPGSTGPFGPP